MTKRKLSADELRRIWATEPSPVNPQATAANSEFVRLLSNIDRSLRRGLMIDQRYEPGEIIFREGDAGNTLYLIWAGRVAVVRGSFQDPKEVLIRYPGELVGEMAILEDKPRWGSLVALDAVRVLRIVKEDFQTLLSAQPALSFSLLAALSARLRAVHAQVEVEVGNDAQLLNQLSSLIDENEELVELQRVRQETGDLIIHDLRSPLGNMYSVLNMLELVLPEDVLTANRELLDIANLAHSRMQDLVDSLLDVSKLQTGEMSLMLTPVDLKALVSEVVALASFSVEQRNIDFVSTIPPDLPLVKADQDRIRRVLTNLVDNAIKYSPRDGKVTISVATSETDVSVSINDNGLGIAPDDRQRIFERFAQVQRTGLRHTRGYGLGLAFCRLAVEAHGGKIWVEDDESGLGSRFIFTLPLSSEEKTDHE